METQFENVIKQTGKNWWVPLLIGILLIITGVWTLFSPAASYVALSILFSTIFLISGILEIYFAVANRNEMHNWGWNLAFGILTTIFGLLLLINPEISMVTLPFYVGFIIMFRSIMAIGWATDLRSIPGVRSGNIMILAILGLIFSFILLWNPLFAGLTIVIWTGLGFLFVGGSSINLSFQLRKFHKEINK
ncbi:MAG: HdeD family acid-resistance protein [Draconibacterium sp.]